MEYFSALLAICAENSPVPGEFPTQRPVTRSFDVFFDLYMGINGWVNNRKAGDLKGHRAHFDVIIMIKLKSSRGQWVNLRTSIWSYGSSALTHYVIGRTCPRGYLVHPFKPHYTISILTKCCLSITIFLMVQLFFSVLIFHSTQKCNCHALSQIFSIIGHQKLMSGTNKFLYDWTHLVLGPKYSGRICQCRGWWCSDIIGSSTVNVLAVWDRSMPNNKVWASFGLAGIAIRHWTGR